MKETIIWRLQVQAWLQVSNNTGILDTFTRLLLTECEQATPVDTIKDVVRSSVQVPEFDKHLKMAGRHIGWIVVEITIKMKTIVRKPWMIKISVLLKSSYGVILAHLRNGRFDKLLCKSPGLPRFNTSRQNNVGEDRIGIINLSMLFNQRVEIRLVAPVMILERMMQ